MRYDSASPGYELEPRFKLEESLSKTHMTPNGSAQKFYYSRFARS